MIKAFWVWGALVLLMQIYSNHFGRRIADVFSMRSVTHGGPTGPGLHHK